MVVATPPMLASCPYGLGEHRTGGFSGDLALVRSHWTRAFSNSMVTLGAPPIGGAGGRGCGPHHRGGGTGTDMLVDLVVVTRSPGVR